MKKTKTKSFVFNSAKTNTAAWKKGEQLAREMGDAHRRYVAALLMYNAWVNEQHSEASYTISWELAKK